MNRPEIDQRLARAFHAFVRSQDFPCIGAKAALGRKQIEVFVADDIRSRSCDRRLAFKLRDFARRHAGRSMFVSFVAVFRYPAILSEAKFERELWSRLGAIHEIDRRSCPWDPAVSANPDSPHFSMSVGGKGFYVVGLHPNASRLARRFFRPTLVFNLHEQFERLRAEGRYQSIKKTILERDAALDGSINPMLAVHGAASEARQYSGRVVGKDWVCPFTPQAHDRDAA